MVVDAIDHAITSPKAKAVYFLGNEQYLSGMPELVGWLHYISLLSEYGAAALA